MRDKSEIEKALRRESWISLYDLASTKPAGHSKNNLPDEARSNVPRPGEARSPAGLSAAARILGYDIVTYLDSQFSERQQRLNRSVRHLENATTELLGRQLIRKVWLGKSLMLAPTAALYEAMGLPSPYKRNVSDTHSFLVLLAEKLIQPNPLVKYTRREVLLDEGNFSVDLICWLKSGQRLAYEIVNRSVTNVAALAARLQGKGYSQVIFLTIDYNTKQRVWTSIKNAGFDPDFLATIRYQLFSTLIRQKKQMMLKELQ